MGFAEESQMLSSPFRANALVGVCVSPTNSVSAKSRADSRRRYLSRHSADAYISCLMLK